MNLKEVEIMKSIFFYLKNSLIRRNAHGIYNTLNRNNSLSREELDRLTLRKLKALLEYVKLNVPYYKRVYKNISIDDIKSLSDWEKLPVLTKDDIKKHSDELIDVNVSRNKLRMVTTGGSTGAPLKVYHDKGFPLDVIGWRVLNWWGVKPSDNISFIYRKVNTGWRLLLNHIFWYPTRRVFLDASLMNPKSMSAFHTKINKTRPRVLQGYVGAVYEFAKFCKENNFKFDYIKAVWVTSAPLNESQRRTMQQVFNAPVYDQYGCSEVFWLAAECKVQNGLHTFPDCRYLEILDENGSNSVLGSYGEIAVTDLTNFSYPLIRYKNGDIGRYLKTNCECGSALPLIDKVRGRVTDVIRLKDGTIISGDYLTTIFDDYSNAVTEFQIRQKIDFSIDIYCVLGEQKNAKVICSSVVDDFSIKINYQADVNLHFVDEIKHEQGKTRFVISDVK